MPDPAKQASEPARPSHRLPQGETPFIQRSSESGMRAAQGFETKVLSEMTSDPETVFLLRRAEEEAILAIQTDPTPAAAAHLELSLRYSARARTSLILGQSETVRGAARPKIA